MRCALCQTDNRAERRYCRECGAGLVPVACEACGFENFVGEKYCGGCGKEIRETRDLTAPAPGPVGATAPPAVPPAVVGDAERRQITVMFCDLVGSTALSEALDAEDLRDVINEFQSTCARVLEAHGGFIARYMGDGMLVYFGYPRAREDSAQRAVRAGLAVLAAVRALPTEPAPRSVRVGIATGQVVIGDLIGQGAAEERAVVGETPNLAARLQSIAEPDTVVISDRTRRLVGGSFELEDLDTHDLKGFAEPVRAWRAVREQSSNQAASHANIPMVGREFELALLADRWKAVRAGQGRAVVLVGDGGSGKSRLVDEAVARAEVPAACRLVYRCARHRESTALYPVIEQIARMAGFEVDDDEAARRQKVLSWVGNWSTELEKDGPAIAALMSLSLGDGADLAGSPGEQRAAMLAALWRSLARKVDAGPLWIVFEDVQWADAATLELVSALLERAVNTNLMVVVTHRATFRPPWTTGGHLTSLSIGRLGPEDAGKLVAAASEDRPMPLEVTQKIVRRGDGVPAHLVELTRAVVAASGDAENGAPAEFVVPETLHDSLAAQLDRLDAGSREIAQVAAAIGREFSRNLLRRVYGGSDANLESGLTALVESGLVAPPGLERGSVYSFRHALLRDVALQTLLRRAQRRLHDRIATVLVEELPTAGQADPDGTAWHLDEAGRPREAADWWRRAGTREAQRAAAREAASLFRRAIASLERAGDPSEPDVGEAIAGLQCAVASQLRLVGAYDEAAEALDHAEQLAAQHDLPALLSEIWFTRGNLMFRTGEVKACLAAHERAREEARRAGSIEAEIRALGGLADATLARGDFAGAVEHCERCVALADEHGFPHIAAPNYAILVYLRGACLRPDAALEAARRGEELSRQCHDNRSLIMAIQASAQTELERGNVDEAERRLQRLAAEGLEPEPFLLRFATLMRAKVLRARGDREQGDAAIRALLPEMANDLPIRQAAYRIAVTGLSPEEEYRAELEAFLELYATPHESHIGHMGLLEAMEVTIYRRDFAALRRVLEVAGIQIVPGWFPELELWAECASALLAWHDSPADTRLRDAVDSATQRARGCGQGLMAEMIDAAMGDGGATAAISG